MKAYARVNIGHELSSDDAGIRPTVFLPQDKTININGERRTLTFRDETGGPARLAIQGLKEFDLDNPFDKSNWITLNILLGLTDMEELTTQITLIDPDKEDREAMAREQKEQSLRTIILNHAEDAEWLGKVYRRVIGSASGIPARTLAKTLLDRAKSVDAEKKTYGLSDFLTKSGKWVFEDEYFETRALLDMCIEKSLIIVDGSFYKLRSDGRVIGHDEAKVLYELQSDNVLRAYLTERVNGKKESIEPAPAQMLNPELLAMIDQVSVPTDSATGTVAKPATDLEATINKLIAAEHIEVDGDSHTLVDIHQSFATKAELIDFLNANAELRKQYEALL